MGACVGDVECDQHGLALKMMFDDSGIRITNPTNPPKFTFESQPLNIKPRILDYFTELVGSKHQCQTIVSPINFGSNHKILHTYISNGNNNEQIAKNVLYYDEKQEKMFMILHSDIFFCKNTKIFHEKIDDAIVDIAHSLIDIINNNLCNIDLDVVWNHITRYILNFWYYNDMYIIRNSMEKFCIQL